MTIIDPGKTAKREYGCRLLFLYTCRDNAVNTKFDLVLLPEWKTQSPEFLR